LSENIKELDKKKSETLEKCFVYVNEKFGEIFSDLLPGAFAKISKIEGKKLEEGIEMMISFNNV